MPGPHIQKHFAKIEKWIGKAAAFFGNRLKGYKPPMEGGRARELIESGKIAVKPDIRQFNQNSILFEDGQEKLFDLVIYCTGFKAVLAHVSDLVEVDEKSGEPLLKDSESLYTPGLFFIGMDYLMNLRSRFIRGMREDAAVVAGRIEGSWFFSVGRGNRQFAV